MKKICINAAVLKWTAFLSMLADHAASLIINQFYVQASGSEEQHLFRLVISAMHLFGRLAFPIFCCLVTEGISHTKNPFRYGTRLLGFAILSEIPFDLVFNHSLVDLSSQNTMFTLFLGFLCVELIERAKENTGKTGRYSAFFIAGVVFLSCLALAEYGHADYGAAGILMIIVMYYLNQYVFRDNIMLCYIIALVPLTIKYPIEIAAMLFSPVLMWYDHSRGKQRKYLFYVLYPLHLLLIYGVYIAMFG